jgi:hypothetical protein
MPWNYKPWGCGSGSKGSCNNGWIQFEICEDDLNDETYFNQVYQEACEITAYLCQLYNIDPNGKVVVNGVSIPTILCHADSAALGFGSSHVDVTHWFPKYGKSMATARADVANLLNKITTTVEEDEDMTQEKFNEMMTAYIETLAKKDSTFEKDAMEWANANGLISGDNQGRLMPKKYLTRGEMAVILKRYDEKK